MKGPLKKHGPRRSPYLPINCSEVVGRSNEKKSRLCEACTEFVDDNLILGGGSDYQFFQLPIYFRPFFVSFFLNATPFYGGNSFFLIFTLKIGGNGIQFDVHNFQLGEFNHEPGLIVQIWEGTCKK